MLKKEVNVNVSKKITSYRLHMTGTTQHKQKCLIFIVLPWSRKNLIRLEGYSTSKKAVAVLTIIKRMINMTIMIIVILVTTWKYNHTKIVLITIIFL